MALEDKGVEGLNSSCVDRKEKCNRRRVGWQLCSVRGPALYYLYSTFLSFDPSVSNSSILRCCGEFLRRGCSERLALSAASVCQAADVPNLFLFCCFFQYAATVFANIKQLLAF